MTKKKADSGKNSRVNSPVHSIRKTYLSPDKKKKNNPEAITSLRPEMITSPDLESDLFRTLMDNTTDRIYFKDAQSRFLLVNRAQAEKFGLIDSAKADGKTDFDFFSEEHARQAFEDERRIMSNGRPLVDLEEKETWLDGRETWVSSTKFPMRDREGKIIGTFGISRDITDRKAMERSIQLANEKLAELVNWLEGRNRDISVLNEMGKMLEACRSPEDAYVVISGKMAEMIPVRTGYLFLFDADHRRMTALASWGERPDPEASISPDHCTAIQSRRMYMGDAQHSESQCGCRKHTPDESNNFLCIPLISQGEMLGVLQLHDNREGGSEAYSDSRQQLAVMAADHIALALSNLSLRETLRVQSVRDALTGLFNRRFLEETLHTELARTKRMETVLGVIMLDLDRFKQVNDTFGHEAGDMLLQRLGQWLETNVRTGDISCRYGGDEFVLILPGASLEATTQRARQMCESIRSLTVEHQGRLLTPVSISVGVAEYPEHGETRDALLAAVDAALYKAKERGRNNVVVVGE